MKTKILLILVLSTFLLAILAEGVLAAKKPKVPPADEAKSTEMSQEPLSTASKDKQYECQDIDPDSGVVILQGPDTWGTTFYDEQQVGSMGRMIAAGPGGQRGMVFHEAHFSCLPDPGYVSYNCKDPVFGWVGAIWIDGGTGICAGYPNIDVMNDGREVIVYHRTAGLPTWWSTLTMGDEGYICSGYFTNKYDLPDWLQADEYGMWPKMGIVYDAVVDTDYFHIVMTENKTSNQRLGYIRCHLLPNGNLLCETPIPNGAVSPIIVPPNVPGGEEGIAYFGEVAAPGVPPGEYPNTISAVVATSPVSRKVAIVFTNKREAGDNTMNNDIFYFESLDNGWDWFPQYTGNPLSWPPAEGNPPNQLHNVTNYPTDYLERAYVDVAACYDYNDSLHIVWNSCFYDSAAQDPNFNCNLMHWSKEHGITVIAPGYWDDGTIDCGEWNRIISKMSISAKDPIYHPGGYLDSVYLFCTWTQFNLGDNAQNDYTNGDIYAAVSNDAGFTWTPGYNLTNTHAPGCQPGDCLSSHWSSLAENMYEGDLHLEYVCDRDAGSAPRDEGDWTDNEMMYLHTQQLPWRQACGALIELVDPPSWCDPPLKVVPGEQRIIKMKLKGIYTMPGSYQVTTDNPNVFCVANCAGVLNPQEEIVVELLINCQGEGFLVARISVTYCGGTPDENTEEIVLHVVQSEDYYECPRDPATWIQKDNCKLKLWACANSEEKVWDKRIDPEKKQKVIFSGGTIVATTWQGDIVVGRQDYSDTRTGARDTINVVESSIPHPDEEQECIIQKIHVDNTFICSNNLPPPHHQRWWWVDIHKQIIMYHDRPPFECPNWKKEQIIKYIWITKSQPPPWWPMPGPQEYEDIYFGYFADIDAPDDECTALNEAGYDSPREMIWHRGVSDGTHPEYDDYYVGLAFTDPTGAVVAPWGCQDVLNEDYLYPQPYGWGWLDGELYRLAATPGVNIHNPGLLADRTVVLTADMIPAGTGDFDSEFLLIEAFIPGDPGIGLAQLQTHIDDTRDILIPELNDLGTIFSRDFPICGDCNEDGVVNIADVVYLVTYLFQNGPPPSWPLNRGDANHDGVVNVADVVYLVTYLFLNGPPPDCTGFGR